MIVPMQCERLLREQRTSLGIVAEYGQTLLRTYESFAHLLPERAERIMDIGCGMAGIDVYLHRHYPEAEIVLVDKQGTAPRINSGYNKHKDRFAHYHDFDGALELLRQNGVNMDRIKTHDVTQQRIPEDEFDVVISLLSWGFHYPIHDYAPNIKPGGVIIADCRVGSPAQDELTAFGTCAVVHQSSKYRRVVCQC